MEKACKCPWRIFDLDRTIAHHRDEIRTERRGRRNFTDLSIDTANQRWDALTAIEKARPDDDVSFMLLWERHGALREWRSEEHTSELQSLMRISYAVFCLKKKKTQKNTGKCNRNTMYYEQIRTRQQRLNR